MIAIEFAYTTKLNTFWFEDAKTIETEIYDLYLKKVLSIHMTTMNRENERAPCPPSLMWLVLCACVRV